ncbi:hypothetical protein ACWDYJ_29815 [Streptomyces sp. NPDC003042]
MKFTRFLCAVALALGIAGTVGVGAASADPAESPRSSAAECHRPGDTEWTGPASHCPPVL